ncbi:M56 family metallopeptidase [Reichenbachiella sp. MALMAid0571]|uniref:M56 family metallopeptidase n=1 Tax=Reichenbachiella sp. MALMAid0571 TaxID=3143939 RepID=UPI0032E037FD
MINLLNYFLEANIILLLFALVYYTLVKDQPNFQFRRIFILTAITSTLLIPLVSVSFSQNIATENFLPKGIATIMLPEFVMGEERKSISTISHLHWSHYLILSYGLVAMVFLARFSKQLFSIWKIVQDSTAKRCRQDGYALIETTKNYPTFSFFKYLVIRNYDNINELERSQIIAHEQVHIKQGHSVDIVMLEVMRAVFWINPGVWFFRKTQAENHEFIADELTLKQHDISEYQQLLIKMTVDQMQLVGNYFAKIQTLKRINMMNEKRSKPNWVKAGAALASTITMMCFFACNDELVEVVQSAEMVVELPQKAQDAMDNLKHNFPKENFVYVEVNKPAEGEVMLNTLKENNISMQTVQFIVEVTERNKLGLILSATANFHKLAELTKDVSYEGDEVFDIVENQPTPIGGMSQFYQYIAQNMKYPQVARNLGIEGRVFVQFVVDKSGKLTNIRPVKGIGAGCDEEAVRVIENAGLWTPGKQKGREVNVRMILPITFKLDKPGENTPNYNSKRLGKIEAPQLEEMVIIAYQK